MDDGLVASLRDAVDRYHSLHMSVFHWEDKAEFRESMGRFPGNQALQNALLGYGPEDEQTESIWSVWVERPYRWRVEHFSPRTRLREIAGGNETAYWQYFPATRQASLLPHTPDQAQTPIPLFIGWLPPGVAELLDPSFLLKMSEGAVAPVRLEVVGETNQAGRAVLRVRAEISDWESRVPWSETIRVADDYEILVDQSTGTLLRVASRVKGREISVYEVFEIQWDLAMHASTFELAVPPGTSDA